MLYNIKFWIRCININNKSQYVIFIVYTLANMATQTKQYNDNLKNFNLKIGTKKCQQKYMITGYITFSIALKSLTIQAEKWPVRTGLEITIRGIVAKARKPQLWVYQLLHWSHKIILTNKVMNKRVFFAINIFFHKQSTDGKRSN